MTDPVINDFPHVAAADAALETGVTRDYLTKLARRGLLRCRKLSGVWFIERSALQHRKFTRSDLRRSSSA